MFGHKKMVSKIEPHLLTLVIDLSRDGIPSLYMHNV